MLVVISPAKKLDFKTKSNTNISSKPQLLEHSELLINDLKKYSIEDLTRLLNISYGLAETNLTRILEWHKNYYGQENSKQAILAFNGDVYVGLDAKSFSEQQFEIAQNKVRIISGLYGLLKPLDLILAYRLPMATKLSNSRGRNLYDFWNNIITDELNKALEQTNSKMLVNLASNEYFKAIDRKKINAEIIDVAFKEDKNGTLRVVSFYAKKARGRMTRYIIENNINNFEDLKGFNIDGYSFSEEQSEKNKLVFVR